LVVQRQDGIRYGKAWASFTPFGVAQPPIRHGQVCRKGAARRIWKEHAMANEASDNSAISAKDPREIRLYHAHIYYDPASRDRAARLRERVAAAFPRATIGRWHDELVGPHTQSMYQIAFPTDLLAAFLPWLMLNRDRLTVLLHPETGDAYTDHSAHAAWLGAVLPLRLDVLRS
jgi:aromatic ring-cleaving dioxygenase